MPGPIIAVVSRKGGVGKTTLAYELAALMSAVLVDLEHEPGGATYRWDPDLVERPDERLGRAIRRPGKAPRPRSRGRRPLLVPSDPMLAFPLADTETLATLLDEWRVQWEDRTVIIDTHPGACWTTDAAIAASDCCVVPLTLGDGSWAATRALVAELGGRHIAVVPSRLRGRPPDHYVERLEELAAQPGVTITAPVMEHSFLDRVKRPGVPLCMAGRLGEARAAAALQFRQVAEDVLERALPDTDPGRTS